MEINIESLLNFLKIKKKAKKDWSKSDQIVLDNFQELKKKGLENLQIQPLNQSSYGDRRFNNDVSPDFQGPMGYAGRGTQDLKAACDWLAKNDISGVAFEGSPLDKLVSIMPTVDPELVQRRLYGSKG